MIKTCRRENDLCFFDVAQCIYYEKNNCIYKGPEKPPLIKPIIIRIVNRSLNEQKGVDWERKVNTRFR
jgi:hypothetical protein